MNQEQIYLNIFFSTTVQEAQSNYYSIRPMYRRVEVQKTYGPFASELEAQKVQRTLYWECYYSPNLERLDVHLSTTPKHPVEETPSTLPQSLHTLWGII